MDESVQFTYEDTDSFPNEIAELYSYSEESDFFANRNAFEESMEDCGLPLAWKHMVPEQKSRAINYLMTTLEVSCPVTRFKSCRALAYLIQGNFAECLSLEDQASNSKENVFLLYKQGIFQAFVQQLIIEANSTNKSSQHLEQLTSYSSQQIFNDSAELRLILSVLCTITETMLHTKGDDNEMTELRQQFVIELQHPIGDELLTVTLFQMLNNFCGGQAQHFPVRKITLLLWKIILITLGGLQELKKIKETKRKHNNLDPLPDDTMEVTKTMIPCMPPLMPDGQARARTAFAGGMMANKRKVFKQPAFDDAVYAFAKECLLSSLAELNQSDEKETESKNQDELNDSTENATNDSNSDDNIDLYNLDEALPKPMPNGGSGDSSSDSGIVNDNDNENGNENESDNDNDNENDNDGSTSDDQRVVNIDEIDRSEDIPGLGPQDADNSGVYHSDPGLIDSIQLPSSSNLKFEHGSQIDGSRSDVSSLYKGLPWAPKVRKTDLIQHLTNIRQKFLGYTLQNDLDTTLGLPDPIVEGINVLRKHLYISLSDVQLEREDAIEKFPLTHGELDQNYREQATERLYAALLPRLPQYMIALLKILLAASTSSKNKSERTESINIMAEINPDVSSTSIIQTMNMNADANRHKEIIIKAISAILILLLKHFKINHVYQFEYVSQQLMFANCIPLILKFLSQDIYSYIMTSKSTISEIDFPACVIGEQPELTTETIELGSSGPLCWRNMFSCINLLRVLNKLTKWKHSRIMMLVVFKSSQTLLKALSVRHPLFQLYVLKLLKVQLKFLGRQWKKNNMKLISPIYQKVRHRLTDDWAYSNDNEAKPWDFQAEEFALQANINKFHQRRYQDVLNPTNKVRDSLMFNQSDRFGGFDDVIDEDYEFGLVDMCRMSPSFERNYERWLENEVFQRKIDWDKLSND